MESIWDHGFKDLHVKPAERPILLSEAPFALQSQREKTAEIMFERFNAPAVFLAKTAFLAATSVGRSSAIVVDVGASCSRVTPVYDGYVMTSEGRAGERGRSVVHPA
jgi:actin-like protein 6A